MATRRITSPLIDTIRAIQARDEILGEILASDLYEHDMANAPPDRSVTPILIDAPEAAALMGISLQAFQQRVQRGQFPRNAIVRTGRRVQFVRARLPGSTK